MMLDPLRLVFPYPHFQHSPILYDATTFPTLFPSFSPVSFHVAQCAFVDSDLFSIVMRERLRKAAARE